MSQWHWVVWVILGFGTDLGAMNSFSNFESPQAHPLRLSLDGSELYVLNTPGQALCVYSLEEPSDPRLIQEIPVGLEPVSFAMRSDDEIWVVGHLSDAISVVSLAKNAVIRTIPVGDSPGDIVFAGTPRRAFVSSMGNRCVQVIDPIRGQVVHSLAIAGDAPCSMVVSEDERTLWVCMRRSGNQTTVVPHHVAPAPPLPRVEGLAKAPRQGLIVRSDDPKWRDHIGHPVLDHDVLEIATDTLRIREVYRGVGTILFNAAIRPGTDELWIANTEARNTTRFEHELRGHVIDSRITRIKTGSDSSMTIHDLNRTLDYQASLPNVEALSMALAQPTDVVFDAAGERAYVAAFGTDRIGILDVEGRVIGRIEVGETPGGRAKPRSKRGPRALEHHPQEPLLYVLGRLSNSLLVIDTQRQRRTKEVAQFDPTPPDIREGRGFLFDAKLSGNGTVSCASCHVDADRDGLAWDLGSREGVVFENGSGDPLHPMKGPLLTQTLRGLRGERLFHWRGDRPGLASFNATFEDLMGGKLLDKPDLATFVRYLRSIRFAPNPRRHLDDSLSDQPVGASSRDGHRLFLNREKVGRDGRNQFRCIDCHQEPSGSGGFGFAGLNGQPMKAAQLRGLFHRDGRSSGVVGFGYGSDGSMASLEEFLSSEHRFQELSDDEKSALRRFLFSFPTETPPIVGHALTIDEERAKTSASEDLALLIEQSERGNCDIIVTGTLRGQMVGFFYVLAERIFLPDRAEDQAMSLSRLLETISGADVLTFTAVPQESGRWLGVDRDGDGILNRDESRNG